MEHSNSKGLAGLDIESRQMVLDTVRQLRKRLLTREKILEFDKHDIFPEDVIREMLGPDIGLQLLFIPEAYGGMGGGARDCCAVTREMSKICLGVATAFFAIQLGSDPIIVGGTEDQKEKWLGAVASGNTLVAYGVTEPGAGSNVAALKTKADPVKDDSGAIIGYLINGNKQFISTGGYADIVTVLAATPEGPSFFVVEKGTKGFSAGKPEIKHGIRASNTAPLTFTDVFVPADHLIGKVPGMGLKQANKVFGYTRLMVASMALGAAEAAFDIVIPYAKERIQFGSPLSEKQGYTHKLVVPNIVNLEAVSAYIDEIATRLDAGEEDLEVEGSIAKLFASEAANKAADDAMQALGGYGYISEFEVEKIKRDVKITCIYEGTSEIQQSIISTFRWKKSRKSKGQFYESIALDLDKLETCYPNIGCQHYSNAARILNQTISWIHDQKSIRSQYVMFCLADMMAIVEIGASMARKAAKHMEESSPLAKKYQLISKIFASHVCRVVTENVAKIVMGCGISDPTSVTNLLTSPSFQGLYQGYHHVISDMDQFADILFEREVS